MEVIKNRWNVGSKELAIFDEELNISYRLLVHYPTKDEMTEVKMGNFVLDLAMEGKIPNELFPLIILSHGNNGYPLLYRTMSTYLAKCGYIVAMVEHFGNNRGDNSLRQSPLNLIYRPKHVRMSIDYMLSHPEFGKYIEKDKIGFIGHSFGGYTGLAIAGGQPSLSATEPIVVEHDSRIKALVIMAPAAGYFMAENALDNISIPIFLLTGEHDSIMPKKWTSELISNRVKNDLNLDLMEVPNAGHFSFLSPFPKDLYPDDFKPGRDPMGFDRTEFHNQLPIWIEEFFLKNLN